MSRLKGTVKWFNNAKGYGFLGYNGGPDVFVHFTSVEGDGFKTLKEGEEVEFDIVQGNNGRSQADRVVSLRKRDRLSTAEQVQPSSSSPATPRHLTD